jgi:proteasome lid subunit RPN8/RPN11
MKQARHPARVAPEVVVASEVARRVRQHAHAHLKTEVCGVLIGAIQDGSVQIDACIPGKDAAQAGTHVTFTQDTWEHIYKVKDAEYPDARIVGWYHSHPGFGIFLSDHDTFIHRNFFSAPEQVAWVYDPHSEEEGFFGWAGDRIQRLGMVSIADERGGEECSETHGVSEPVAEADDEGAEEVIVASVSAKTRSLQWIVTVLSHLVAIVVGLLIAWYIFPRVLVVPIDPQTGRMVHEPMEISPLDFMRGAPENHSLPPASAPPQTSGQPAQDNKGENAQPR